MQTCAKWMRHAQIAWRRTAVEGTRVGHGMHACASGAGSVAVLSRRCSAGIPTRCCSAGIVAITLSVTTSLARQLHACLPVWIHQQVAPCFPRSCRPHAWVPWQENLKIKAVRDENQRELDASNSALWAAVGALKKSLRGYQRRISAVKAQMMSRDNYLSARVSSLTSGLGRAKVGMGRQLSDMKVRLAVLEKNPGPAGTPGKPGKDGAPGLPGLRGLKGPRGARGPPGYQGPRGRDGRDGLPGSMGPRGDMGIPGPQGPRGPTGIAGAPGPRGPQGPPGIGRIGPTGAPGPAGPRGVQGPQGPTGQAGVPVRGPSGPTGPSGPAGVPGSSGAAGPPGPAGVPGVSGAVGYWYGHHK